MRCKTKSLKPTDMRFITTILLCLIVVSVSAQKVVDKIVGVVNDKIILLSDIEAQNQQYIQEYGENTPANLKCELLDQVMTQKLMLAQSILDSVEIADEDVDNELDKRVRYFSNMTGGIEKLEEYYGKSIVEIKDEFRTEIRDQMLSSKEQQNIIADAKVNPSDIKVFFNKIPTDSLPYYDAEVQVGQIIFKPQVIPEMKQFAIDKINDLRNRAMKGEDFATLASLYTEDPGSIDKGGELGFFNRGEMDPNFEGAAFSLKVPGDISQVVESNFGYHIIQLIERRGERINVRHILITPKTTSFDLIKAKSRGDTVYQKLIVGQILFTDAVNKFSEDEESKNNGGMLVNSASGNTFFTIPELGDNDKSLVFTIDSLKAGEFSKPELFRDKDGKMMYRIVFLKTESVAHKGNMKDDYDKFQAAALSQKQADIFLDWVKEKIARSYTFIDPKFSGCETMTKWKQTAQKP
ncbi:MAG: peptidylprolyl isomerase [Sphingobacteriales bacterium]|nr:MAG: peptidylprolyl isomerase [Sphingobacteriales bacterium]